MTEETKGFHLALVLSALFTCVCLDSSSADTFYKHASCLFEQKRCELLCVVVGAENKLWRFPPQEESFTSVVLINIQERRPTLAALRGRC